MKKKRYVIALGKSGRVGGGGRRVGLRKLGAISRPEKFGNHKSIVLVKIRLIFLWRTREGFTAFPLPTVTLVKSRLFKYIDVPDVWTNG